jgi:hypothetical protein
MTEVDLLERFREDLPPADPATLRQARDRLLAEAGGASASPGPARSSWLSLSRLDLSRLGLWRLGPRWLPAAGGAALVIAAALFVAGNFTAVRAPTSPAPTSPAPTSPGPTSPAPTSFRDTDGPSILNHAALAAQHLPDPATQPDRYVFVEWVTDDSKGPFNPEGEMRMWQLGPPTLHQLWLSVDGTKPGLLRERLLAGGPTTEHVLFDCPGPCHRTRYGGYLPTTTDAMAKYLYEQFSMARGHIPPPDGQAFMGVGYEILESERYLPPLTRSALFSAAARIPGLTVERDAVDAVGRHGVAVARESYGLRLELIFDRATYAFLGEHVVVTEDHDGLTKGLVFGSTASLREAVVDRSGQVP